MEDDLQQVPQLLCCTKQSRDLTPPLIAAVQGSSGVAMSIDGPLSDPLKRHVFILPLPLGAPVIYTRFQNRQMFLQSFKRTLRKG
jgi:hypothetical protein